MIRANLTGEFASGPWRLCPQAAITHFEETQDGYTDSLGVAIPEQAIALGRLRAGPEVAWRTQNAQGGWVELTTAINAVWDYQSAEQLSEAGLRVGGDEDLRADARLEIAAGGWMRLEAGFDGLGAGDFEARTLRVGFSIPFGASGGRGGVVSASSLQLACDSRPGQGFVNAAGRPANCGAVGFTPPMH